MDHREFLARMSPDQKARLNARCNGPGLLHLGSYVVAIVGLAILVAIEAPGWPLCIVMLGICLCFLFTLEHEATHKTPFASEILNEWVGRVCGFILVLPFTWFRYFHLAHHRFTHDPERDPELLALAKPDGWRDYLIHVSGVPHWYSSVVQFARLLAGRGMADYVPSSARGRIVAETRWMLLGYALAGVSLFFTPLLFWVWLLPVLLGQPFLRLYLLAEHGRCPHVADMFENTRTTITTALVRWLAWNMPYHAEHHAMPTVPFHNLPELHKLTVAHLRETEAGYVAFHRKYTGDFAGN